MTKDVVNMFIEDLEKITSELKKCNTPFIEHAPVSGLIDTLGRLSMLQSYLQGILVTRYACDQQGMMETMKSTMSLDNNQIVAFSKAATNKSVELEKSHYIQRMGDLKSKFSENLGNSPENTTETTTSTDPVSSDEKSKNLLDLLKKSADSEFDTMGVFPTKADKKVFH